MHFNWFNWPSTDKDDVNNGEHFIDFVDIDGNTVLERE